MVMLNPDTLRAVAERATQAVIDEWAEGLLDEPQDVLVARTATMIEMAIRNAAEPSVPDWVI